jgi:REP element-mobilizing transposase RayT
MEIDTIDPGFYYHVFNRGVNHEIIFPEKIYFQRFTELYEKYMPPVADIVSFCLLPSHFHFLLFIKENPSESPSNQFSHFFNSYAQWFNKLNQRNGGLFQRPFKRKRIKDQDYLRRVIYYIHRNPLHHKLTKAPELYQYSSYGSIAAGSKFAESDSKSAIWQGNDLIGWHIPVQTDLIFDLFESRQIFIDFHQQNFEMDESLFYED